MYGRMPPIAMKPSNYLNNIIHFSNQRTMAKFKVGVQWTVTADLEIEAETLEQAKQIADQQAICPDTHEYLDDSYEVNHEYTDFLQEFSGAGNAHVRKPAKGPYIELIEDMRDALDAAESFAEGFEGDEAQEDMSFLGPVRNAIAAADKLLRRAVFFEEQPDNPRITFTLTHNQDADEPSVEW